MWPIAATGSIIGALIFIAGMTGAESVEQEISMALYGIGFAVIPCCLAFALSHLDRK